MQRKPELTPQEKIDRWAGLAKDYNGWAVFSGNSIDDSENLHIPHMWEFRLAVPHDNETLQKAIHALAVVFKRDKNAGICFKCQTLDKPDDKHYQQVLSVWDGATAVEGTDRDQRGKEICVYMTYDPATQQYIRTPEQWKELMLEIWKSLLDSGVEKVGYAACPYGDRNVTAELGMTVPFTYTAFKPYKQRNGILFEGDYNPHHLEDPLDGVVITRNDLVKYGIHTNHVAIQTAVRNDYYTDHVLSAVNKMHAQVAELKQSAMNKPDLAYDLASLVQKAMHADNLLQFDYAEIMIMLPVCSQGGTGYLAPHPLASELERCLMKKDDVELKNVLAKIEKYHFEQRDQALTEIFNDFKSRPELKGLLVYLGIDDLILRLMIASHTSEMQKLFTQMIHLEREQKSYLQLVMRHNRVDISTLVDIIMDNAYWLHKTQGNKIPSTILALQKLVTKYTSLVSGLDDTEFLQKFLDECKYQVKGNVISRHLFRQDNKPESAMCKVITELNTFDDLRADKQNSFKALCLDREHFQDAQLKELLATFASSQK